jgi:hypothetical protein
MSPEAEERRFGRTPAQAARAAVVLALLGIGAVGAGVRFLTRPGSPLAAAFAVTGIPPLLLFVAGSAAVIALAAGGFFQAVRAADRFRLTRVGLEVSGRLGAYCLGWDNVAAAGISLGIRVHSREAVLATHAGTPRQREWLRTMEPFGDWDFLYPRADLGVPPAEVLRWIDAARGASWPAPGSEGQASLPPG